jgi:hypothetical protein
MIIENNDDISSVHWTRRALAQHSDQVLNAILSMADRWDLHLARKARDLRQKVFELAAIMERPELEL